jgi:hypothetical protein
MKACVVRGGTVTFETMICSGSVLFAPSRPTCDSD